MNRRSFLSSAAGAIAATKGLLASARSGRTKQRSKEETLKSVRIVQVDDMAPIGYMAKSPTREVIREHVASYADNGADVLVFDLANSDHCHYKSRVSETWPPRNGEGLDEPLKTNVKNDIRNTWDMIDNGIDLPAVLAESVHQVGKRFWPGIRLNSCNYLCRIKREHPDWVLPIGPHIGPGYLDYAQEGVRAHVLAQARELVEDYDSDGLYLNFVRNDRNFHPDRAYSDAPLFTEWLGEIRSMLDEVGAKKGKPYLPLAAQVLSRLQDGLTHGHDYAAWAQEGFVDYICPGRTNNIDLNIPMDQWRKAVEGTACRIFPVVQPNLRFPFGTVNNQMTRDKFRAAVHNYYEGGAHGLSSMNLMSDFDDEAIFVELRDRKRVAQGKHHYHFASPAYSSYGRNLNYELEPNVMRQGYQFRMETDPTQRKPGVIRVTISGVHPSDVIEIDLNHKFFPRYPQWGVVDESTGFGVSRGHRRIPIGSAEDGVRSYRYDASLADLPLRKGENSLGLRVASRGVGVNVPRPLFQGLEILI